jgi:hypothetical protein
LSRENRKQPKNNPHPFHLIKSRVSLFQFVTPSDGARPVCGVLATKMPLLTELGDGINDIRLFYENDARFLKQF